MITEPRKINSIIAYYRLSKPKRGKSKYQTMQDAYGIKDQKREIQLLSERYNAPIVGEFIEIESATRGKRQRRVELAKAIRQTRVRKATLVIGKQDRLGRDAGFVITLANSGVHFVSADRPDQSEFEMGIRAVVDQEEAKRISERVKAGMAVAASQGVKFGFARADVEEKAGHRRGYLQASKAAAEARRDRFLKNYEGVIDVVLEQRDAGKTLGQIAALLNEMGQTTSTGMPVSAMAVHRLIKIAEEELQPKSRRKAK